jgi:hypothetical protein
MASEGDVMKKRIAYLISLVLFVALTCTSVPTAAYNYGQIRALKRRAVTVMRQKNEFVARVLRSYNIQYQTNEQGIVVGIQIGGKWVNVSRTEIVPVLGEEGDGFKVLAHEIFFFTDEEILHLVSATRIR